MQTLRLERPIPYTGAELRSHWCQEQSGVYGDILVAFEGPCQVPTENLVDREDAAAGSIIRAKRMLHFIAEHFGWSLREMVLAQRLLVCQAFEVLRELGDCPHLRRMGDDLHIGDAKLSVSIATVSPVSGLIHFGLNIDASGSPVKAATLAEAGVLPRTFAEALLDRYRSEYASVDHARVKVRPVF